MNTKSQLLIDKYLAKPIAYLLNFVVRIVGQVLRIDHRLDKDFTTIAVCKFKGMGSVLQSTPMLSAIRKRYPKAQIIYVSTQSNRKLLGKIDWVDTIITVDDSSLWKFVISNIKSLFALIKMRPQVYFDLEIYADYSTLFTLFTLSTNRVGFYLRSSSFRMGIYTHMMFFNPNVPISKVYLQLAQLIDCDTADAPLYPLKKQLQVPPPREREYIVINPNASDLRLERRWGKSNFITLIEWTLAAFPDVDILLIGSPAERAYTSEIAGAIPHKRLHNQAGKTSLEELFSLIAHAKIMVSNDTGPMHLAFCTQTPVICLFGPCSPEQYGRSAYAHILYKRVYCSPCVHDFEVPPCKGDNVCMKLIPTIEVFDKLQQLMADPQMLPQAIDAPFVYKNEGNVLGKVNRR